MATYEGEIPKPVSGKSSLPRKTANDALLKELEEAFLLLPMVKPIGQNCFWARTLAAGKRGEFASTTTPELDGLIGRKYGGGMKNVLHHLSSPNFK